MTEIKPEATPYTFDRVIRIAFACFIVWALVNLASYLSEVLIPFGVAVLIAYLMNPLVNLVQKKIPHRGLAVFVSLTGVSLVVVGLSYIFISMIINEMIHFGSLVQGLAQSQQWEERLIELLPSHVVEEIKHLLTNEGMTGLLTADGAWETASSYLSSLVPWLQDVGLGLMSLLGLSVIALYVIFLLIDYDWFQHNWNKIIPPQHRGGVDGFVGEFNQAMHRHFRAQAVVAAICGVLFAIGFSIVGLPMAIIFGLFVGFLNMIPYVQILALIPAFFLALMQSLETGSSISWCMGMVLLIFILVQALQDAVLVPRIMGKAFGLRPVVILLSIMIWGKLLGLLGLIIALPLTCLAWAWYHRLVIAPHNASD